MSATHRLLWNVRSQLNRPVSWRRALVGGSIVGTRVLITGASSGVGRATAAHLAAQGARVMAVARRERELEELCDEIARAGGDAVHHACDLTEPDQVDGLVRRARDGLGGVDVLVNNAARSMRRPLVDSFDRLDDAERAMAVNYVGPVRLTMGLLPGMLARGRGHVVNVGTWTVPVGTSPRFAAYHSSKAALTGFGRCVDAELAGRGVRVTAVHYPLVHTPMSAPTAKFRNLPGLTPEEAAEWILAAIRTRPRQIVPRYVVLLRALGLVSPRSLDRLLLRLG